MMRHHQDHGSEAEVVNMTGKTAMTMLLLAKGISLPV